MRALRFALDLSFRQVLGRWRDFMAAHASLEIAHGVDGDRTARAYPRAAQRSGEGRAGARTHGGRGIGLPRVGCRGFAFGYPLDVQGRVERIANAAPPHGAESCRGSRPASNAALFDILRLRRNLAAAVRLRHAAASARVRAAALSVGGGTIGGRSRSSSRPGRSRREAGGTETPALRSAPLRRDRGRRRNGVDDRKRGCVKREHDGDDGRAKPGRAVGRRLEDPPVQRRGDHGCGAFGAAEVGALGAPEAGATGRRGPDTIAIREIPFAARSSITDTTSP